jgi:MscS family membrane protein
MHQFWLNFPFFSDPTLPKVLAVLVLVAVITLAIKFSLYRLERAAKQTDTIWDDALIYAARRPAPVLVWVVGLAYAAHIIHKDKDWFFLEFVQPLRDIAIIACGAWFLFRLIDNAAHKMLVLRARQQDDDETVDRTTIDALSKLSRFMVIVISVVMVMHVMGLSVSGVLAFGGLGGIAVGFAAKDLLANFFGGLTIYMDRPFVVGESIRSPDKTIEGKIEHIGWRLTRLRSLNKSAVYIPNALFTTIVVENTSRITHRRIHEAIGIRYNDISAMPTIVSDVREMLATHPQVDHAEELNVSFDRMTDSALNFSINVFTLPAGVPQFLETKQAILLSVAAIISRHSAEIAFPTQTICIESGS